LNDFANTEGFVLADAHEVIFAEDRGVFKDFLKNTIGEVRPFGSVLCREFSKFLRVVVALTRSFSLGNVDSFSPAHLAPEVLPSALSRAATLAAWVPFGPTFGRSFLHLPQWIVKNVFKGTQKGSPEP
jgi:hypothetical protein